MVVDVLELLGETIGSSSNYNLYGTSLSINVLDPVSSVKTHRVVKLKYRSNIIIPQLLTSVMYTLSCSTDQLVSRLHVYAVYKYRLQSALGLI